MFILSRCLCNENVFVVIFLWYSIKCYYVAIGKTISCSLCRQDRTMFNLSSLDIYELTYLSVNIVVRTPGQEINRELLYFLLELLSLIGIVRPIGSY